MRQTFEASNKSTTELYADGNLTYTKLDKLGKDDPAFFDFEINPDTAIDHTTGEIHLPPATHHLSVVAITEIFSGSIPSTLRRAS